MIRQMNTTDREAAEQALAQRLQFTTSELPLLRQALTHPAFFEGSRHPNEADNQRLEFLGDAVLDMIVGEYLYHAYPSAQEGVLSKMRAFIVCEASLAAQARQLGVRDSLRLGRGSELSGDRERASVLADAVEAVIGAVFVAHGISGADALLRDMFAARMDTLTPDDYEDKKSRLQEVVQAIVTRGVRYKIIETSGPDHQPHFISAAYCGALLLGKGEGGSKKESEAAAAADALSLRDEWLDKLE